MPVLCAAKRFEIPLLASKCVSVLKSEIKDSTAVSMYQAAKLLQEETLAEESLNYILHNGSAVVQEEDFLLITNENLNFLLERDDFEVEELELFQAVCKWAQKECEKQEIESSAENQRLVLKGTLKNIRFPLMSSKDFAIHVAPTDILMDKEMISLLIQYSIPASERAGLPLLAHGFTDRERKSKEPPKKRAKTGRNSLFDKPTTVLTLENGGDSVDMKDVTKTEGMNGVGSPTALSAVGGDWRNPMAGLKFNLMSMYENHYNSDVIFVIGEQREKVFGHKFILSLWSSVFEQKFNARADSDEPIEITEFNPSGFRSFLKVCKSRRFSSKIDHFFKTIVFFLLIRFCTLKTLTCLWSR